MKKYQRFIDLSNAELISSGSFRDVYLYPNDPVKLIKVTSSGEPSKQHKQELHYFKKLNRYKNFSYTHIPHYYGECMTNLGTGLITEAIRDYDGNISKQLLLYVQKNGIEPYVDCLFKLKTALLTQKILFTNDATAKNIVLRRLTPTKSECILIDGFGDSVFIPILNRVPYLLRKKQLRRWERSQNKTMQMMIDEK